MKLCECGCGSPAPIAKRNHSGWGWIKDQPMRFLRGHGNLGKPVLPGPHYLRDGKTGCWIWQHYKDPKGYGVIKKRGKNYKAHRFYYEQEKGKIPNGYQLDHKCRNTSCINPDHLEIVDNAENCRRGSNTKLTKCQVIEIRKKLSENTKQAILAREFMVSPCTINDIAKGRAWA